jgi:aspartyl-tRNA(Asn)/glutamyl-tRNA(Gln) amidotransferase subunit A
MSGAANLHNLTIAEAAPLLRTKRLSPVELIDAMLTHIEAVDGVVHSFVTVAAEQARTAAREAEAEIMAGRYRGSLHGIPYGLKDNFFTRGIRTAAGSRLTLNHIPDTDATAHQHLQRAGAILLGKLSTYEYGTGNGTDLFELPFPPARNPWDPRCFTGGSSTGAGAGVAAGTTMLALGTDTTGSVRLPAAACGVVGLKPTYGLVSRAGILPNCWSLDSVGPLAWTAEDTAHALQVIVGFDPLDPSSTDRPPPNYTAGIAQGAAGLRIGVVRRFHERDIACAPTISAAFDKAVRVFAALGAEMIELDLPVSLQDFRNCSRIINVAECFAIHERDYVERRQMMGPALREKLTAGVALRAVDYLRAQRWRRELTAAVEELFRSCDVLLCAGTTRRAPRFDDPAGIAAFTAESAMAAFSISGHPALSICTGFAEDSLPAAMQIAGRYFDEAAILRAAAAFEHAAGNRARRPDPLKLGSNFAAPSDALQSSPAVGHSAVRDPAALVGIDVTSDAEVQCIEAQTAAIRATAARLPAELPKNLEPMTVLTIPGRLCN